MTIQHGYSKLLAPKVRQAFGDDLYNLVPQQKNLANLLIEQAVKRRGSAEEVTVAELEGIGDLVMDELWHPAFDDSRVQGAAVTVDLGD